jgi:hypothetical protein
MYNKRKRVMTGDLETVAMFWASFFALSITDFITSIHIFAFGQMELNPSPEIARPEIAIVLYVVYERSD